MRAYHRIQVQLSKADEQQLRTLLRGGVQQVRGVLRALALLQLASGQSAPAVARNLTLSPKSVRAIARRFLQGGLEPALYEKQRPGARHLLDAARQQRIIAMVCSDPPEGRARWTVRLVVQEAVKRKLVPRVGRETIRILLQSHDLKPWREINVVRRSTR